MIANTVNSPNQAAELNFRATGTTKDTTGQGGTDVQPFWYYLRRVRVPFIFCELNVLRKTGSSRSMSSK